MSIDILHFPTVHFTGITSDDKCFVYCPVGKIVSWSQGDWQHKWCHFCQKFFNEIVEVKQ